MRAFPDGTQWYSYTNCDISDSDDECCAFVVPQTGSGDGVIQNRNEYLIRDRYRNSMEGGTRMKERKRRRHCEYLPMYIFLGMIWCSSNVKRASAFTAASIPSSIRCHEERSKCLAFMKSEEAIREEIELSSHSEEKILLGNDLISGTINITSIRDLEEEEEVEEEVKVIKTPEIEHKNGFIVPERTRSMITPKGLWKRRHARSIEEGIRSEKDLSGVFDRLHHDDHLEGAPSKKKRRGKRRKKKYAARTIAALIVGLAEEAEGLEVEVDARRDTPLWGKHVDAVRINFSRLGFKPLRMSGLDQALSQIRDIPDRDMKEDVVESLERMPVITVDEAFRKIDVDNSGVLDEEEVATALMLAVDEHHHEQHLAGLPSTDDEFALRPTNSSIASRRQRISKQVFQGLASRLVRLYDTDGKKALDLQEYQVMVEDMAALRRVQKTKAKEKHKEAKEKQKEERLKKKKEMRLKKKKEIRGKGNGLWSRLVQTVRRKKSKKQKKVIPKITEQDALPTSPSVVDISDDKHLTTPFNGEGSIILSDLKLDLRRLLFGAFPWVKTITPGGPLILEPFTMTVSGSFNREDILNSGLINTGLRLLVARALRRRVRSIRDLLDGAVFYGRTWNLQCETAPSVEIPSLEDIEFDDKDRLIISGRALVRASPDAPLIEQAFKVRTRIGTRDGGRVIRLKDPEIAIVLECPESWERGIVGACKKLDLPIPKKPTPLYTYIPLVSPFKVTDKDGFNLGEDNCIQSIDIKDGALRLELSAVLRPGRFLGNHYIAFTVPNKTFIVTLDRVREGIKVARRNKKLAEQARKQRIEEREEQLLQPRLPPTKNGVKKPLPALKFRDPDAKKKELPEEFPEEEEEASFMSKFLQHYLKNKFDERDEDLNARLTSAVSEWFGRQEINGGDEDMDDDSDTEDYEDDRRDRRYV